MNQSEWQEKHEITDTEMERIVYIKNLFKGRVDEVRPMQIEDEA